MAQRPAQRERKRGGARWDEEDERTQREAQNGQVDDEVVSGRGPSSVGGGGGEEVSPS